VQRHHGKELRVLLWTLKGHSIEAKCSASSGAGSRGGAGGGSIATESKGSNAAPSGPNSTTTNADSVGRDANLGDAGVEGRGEGRGDGDEFRTAGNDLIGARCAAVRLMHVVL
jgi:hypothetical protein